MSPRTLLALLLSLLLAVGGCERDDAQAALEKANSELQESLEAKRAAALRDALHPDFLAQDRHDRNWATRTAGTLFLRHRKVRVWSSAEPAGSIRRCRRAASAKRRSP